LKYHRHIAVTRIDTVYHFIADDDLTLGRLFQTSDHPHGRGLTAARRAQQHQKLLILDIEGHFADACKGTIAFDDVGQFDRRHGLSFHCPHGQTPRQVLLDQDHKDQDWHEGKE